MLLAAGNGQALWFVTRGSGAVALLLLTFSVVLGVTGSTRWKTSRWPRFLVLGLHRNVTLLAIAFVGVHVVTTVADAFAPVHLLDAVVPFRSPYRPVWLGLGTVAFDLLLALTITSLLRARIGARAWRLVHWLAYASWPVAILHSLGTGSDARSAWLPALGLVSGVAVVGAVAWRIATAGGSDPAVRSVALLATAAVLIGLTVWARSGPLERGWAARAGTPARLLGTRSPARSQPRRVAVSRTPAAIPPAATLPSGSFQSTLQGTIREEPAPQGLVTIVIDAHAKGRFVGRIHIALRGAPAEGGGVEMIDSVVGLLPAGAASWDSGRVIGLDGQRILTSVRAPGGRPRHVLLDLRIDPSAGRVAGRLEGRGQA